MEVPLYSLIIILACIVLSAFFSATETAYTSFNRTKMKNLAAEGNKKAAKVLKMSESYDKLLSTILVGNNIVNITLSSVAKTFGYNEKYLSHTLHALTQMHFSHLLSLYRIQAAKRLLEGAERKNITEIATACGFGAINTFHRAFKETVGVTPSEYREKFKK